MYNGLFTAKLIQDSGFAPKRIKIAPHMPSRIDFTACWRVHSLDAVHGPEGPVVDDQVQLFKVLEVVCHLVHERRRPRIGSPVESVDVVVLGGVDHVGDVVAITAAVVGRVGRPRPHARHDADGVEESVPSTTSQTPTHPTCLECFEDSEVDLLIA